MKVAAIWASLNEDVVVDSEVYTDLDALQAPLWTIHLEPSDNVPSLMVKNLLYYLDTCRSTDTTEKILGKNYTVLQSPGHFLPLTIFPSSIDNDKAIGRLSGMEVPFIDSHFRSTPLLYIS